MENIQFNGRGTGEILLQFPTLTFWNAGNEEGAVYCRIRRVVLDDS